MNATTIRGKLLFHSETGTEGGHWAVQDDAHVHGITGLDEGGRCPWGEQWCPVQRGDWHEHARYEGMHFLRDGDRLTVFDHDGKTVKWQGEVELIRHRPFTEDARGVWINSDQAGTPRLDWADMFFAEMPCELERDEA